MTRRSERKGRPSATMPVEEVTTYQAQITVQRVESALAEASRLVGWRINVTTSPAEALSLVDAMARYRDEWTAEHGSTAGSGARSQRCPCSCTSSGGSAA